MRGPSVVRQGEGSERTAREIVTGGAGGNRSLRGEGGERSGDPPPSLPYTTADGESTEGWSGSETSHERATEQVKEATAYQRYVVDLISERGRIGMTWAEVARATGHHHGRVSGVLSVLHQAGRLQRLTIRRDRSEVYVTPEHVSGRPLAPYKPNRRTRTVPMTDRENEARERLAQVLADDPMVVVVEAADLETILHYSDRARGAT